MKKIVLRGLYFTLFVGGLSCLGVAAANAADTTSGDDGLLSGTQAAIGLEVPVDLSGNSISILGDATSTAPEVAPAAPAAEPAAPAAEPADGATTSGDDGIASGTQAIVDVAIPIDVSGNAISVVGDSEQSGATEAAPAPEAESAPATTVGTDSLLGGTQGLVNIEVPITVGGNAITVVGDSSSTDSTSGASTAGGASDAPAGTGSSTSGDDGILGGTQVVPVVGVPVTVGGNAITLIGDPTTTGSDLTGGSTGGSSENTTGGDGSIGGGTQIIPVINLPIDLGGNAITVIGDPTVVDPTGPTTPTDPTDPTDPTNPTDPTDPTTPTDPGTPTTTTAVAAGSVTGAGYSASAYTGGSNASGLALTGVSAAPLAGAIALLLLAGLALTIVSRRKSARV
ncbi:Small secreted domain [Agreia bicolorata]|uniref:Small secreted domain n=1 Tax=Agreia bicolorata TaxID=110935 RepID=A0A1T4YNF7_9MICO|nr:chaplin family protein [Agreia bicolorata]SKB03296.1 Small secreted domain [Agreia bicolorata]